MYNFTKVNFKKDKGEENRSDNGRSFHHCAVNTRGVTANEQTKYHHIFPLIRLVPQRIYLTIYEKI